MAYSFQGSVSILRFFGGSLRDTRGRRARLLLPRVLHYLERLVHDLPRSRQIYFVVRRRDEVVVGRGQERAPPGAF